MRIELILNLLQITLRFAFMTIDSMLLDSLTAQTRLSPRLRMDFDLWSSPADGSQYLNWMKHNRKLYAAGRYEERVEEFKKLIETSER